MAAPSAPPSMPGYPQGGPGDKVDGQPPDACIPPSYSSLYPPAGQTGATQPPGPQFQTGVGQPQGPQFGAQAAIAASRHLQQQQYGAAPHSQTDTGADGSSTYAENDWEGNLSGFTEKSVRLAFIKKVFAILAVMLIITAGIMCIFMFVEPIKEYASEHIWVYLVSIFVYLGAVFALICAGDLRRKVPHNLIFLGLISIFMGVMLGCIAATYSADEVLMAVGITLIVTLGMVALGFQKKFDFTYMTGILTVLTFVLIGFGLMCIIFRSEILYIFYAALGAGLFSIWIVVDVQLMLGGEHKFAISPEEYVVAALNLYLDIINLFLYLLMLIGAVKN